jgi:hypothetical protein
VSDDVTIAGAGADRTVIDGDGTDRVFDLKLSGAVEISGVTIQHGYDALRGGGIYNTADLTITRSTLSNNKAIDAGGGIFNMCATVTLIDTTVSENRSGYGAGINNSSGTIYLNNSTVSGNDASAPAFQPFPEDYVGSGGGIFNTGSIAISNSTIVENYAVDDGGGILANTIVAHNDAIRYDSNCRTSVTSPLASLGYNLMELGRTCGSPVSEDWIVADAMIGPLADNGGPTQTHALLAGSPAIDSGGPECPPPATDQRGVARPQGASCDIGVVEFVPEPTGPLALIAGAMLLGELYRRRR